MDSTTDEGVATIIPIDTAEAAGNGEARPKRKRRRSAKQAEGKGQKLNAAMIDPAPVAAKYLGESIIDGLPTQRFWRGTFWLWGRGAYRELSTAEARADVARFLGERFAGVTTGTVANVLEHIRAQSILPGATAAPAWLTEPATWPPGEILAARNGLIHLPSLVGRRQFLHRPTPRFLTTAALDYDFDPDAPPPALWLRFVHTDLWPDDPASVAALQEWMGYLLTADTRQQKIFMLVGPKRAGKGVIARVLRAMIGAENVAGPTLASLTTQFGLWPLLGKSLAIISDARLSGRTDQAIVVERLLSVSGEDAPTIDRKNLEPVTVKLPTRFMILSNELPRLSDSSGAVTSRMILLRLQRSFYGREDHTLTDRLLGELPGILLWSIEGWRRLWERGRFVQPDSSMELLGELNDLASPIGAFIRERCIVGAEYEVARAELYVAYSDWAKSKGREHVEDETGFGRALRAAMPNLGDRQHRIDGQPVRFYAGLTLA